MPNTPVVKTLTLFVLGLGSLTAVSLVPSVSPLAKPHRPLGERIDREEQELVRLTEQQMGILDNLADVARIAVKGDAGLGNTLSV
jgi:hypothetical protein